MQRSMLGMWILIVITAQVVYGCKECLPCECSSIMIQRRMACKANCSNRNLTSIPILLSTITEYITELHLDLSNNQLGHSDLQNLKSYTDYLTSLNLSYNNITYIPPGVLATASLLQELDLEGNILEHVNSSIFGYLKQLRKLTGIHSLHFGEDTFENLKGLDELSIVFDNDIVSENIFNSLKLKTLHLEVKSMAQIPTNLFRFGVDTLVDLQLNVPHVRSLHEDTFSGLPILKCITIRSKEMRTLPDFIFHPKVGDNRKMPLNLVEVIIDGVKSLPRKLFEKQQSLKHLALNNIEDLVLSGSESQVDTLDLSGSILIRLTAEMFSEFKSLRFLNLSRTKISELSNDTFKQLSSLTVLDLSFNNIKNLPDGLFQSSKNTLLTINISNNEIQNISRYTFEAVKSLEKLDIGHNLLQNIDEYAFQDLFMLTDICLEDNKLVFFSDNTLKVQMSLLNLNIARNKVKQLPPNLFKNTHSLRRLDLTGNEIETLPQDFFESMRHLEYVSLGQNPVNCDCSLMLLRNRLPRVHMVGRCEAPPELFNTSLGDLKLDDSCQPDIVLSTSFSSLATPFLFTTPGFNSFLNDIESTTFENGTKSVHIEPTTIRSVYPTIMPTSEIANPEQAKGGGSQSSFYGTTAFYIAIASVGAVFGGAIVGFVVFRTRRKMRSRAYEVREVNDVQHNIEVEAESVDSR